MPFFYELALSRSFSMGVFTSLWSLERVDMTSGLLYRCGFGSNLKPRLWVVRALGVANSELTVVFLTPYGFGKSTSVYIGVMSFFGISLLFSG